MPIKQSLMKIMQLRSKTTSRRPILNMHLQSSKGSYFVQGKEQDFFFFTKLEIKGLNDRIPSSVKKICLKIPSYFSLPSVTIVKKFFFVVKQLLMSFSSKFEVWTLKTKNNLLENKFMVKKSNIHVKHEHLNYTIYQF